MTFYLKYRSQTLEELDIASVRESLKKILAGKNIPHAFLFSGPKGTGKTSAARILAKIINCDPPSPGLRKGIEPCNICEMCTSITRGTNMDVVEMDAASNRGIDDVRALRETVALAPVSARKKIYIIDEAHMLTTEAGNALLKTLEEPPAHVIFILATTNPEKLPETVRSRLISINFTKATVDEVTRQLGRIITGEKIKAEDGVLEVIAKAADGSFRDATKILESLATHSKNLKLKETQEILFQTDILKIDNLLNFLSAKDSRKALEEIESVIKNGGSLRLYVDTLIEKLRASLLAKSGIGADPLGSFGKAEILTLLEALLSARNEIAHSTIAQLPLEIAIVKYCDVQKQNIDIPKIITSPKLAEEKVDIKAVPGENLKDETWRQILSVVKSKNTSIEALLRAAHPLACDGQTLRIGVYYQFHKEHLEEVLAKRTLEDVVAQIFGKPLKISYILTQKEKKVLQNTPDILTEAGDKDIIEAAKEIFGN